ncbi:MAG: TlpA family protein disulfide reductase [Bacteroidetes bacterium]|nr:MAG: TlpA family protein disulfide reductase [Bacteroidota bacterium]
MGKKILKIIAKIFVFFLGMLSAITFMKHYPTLKTYFYPSSYEKEIQQTEKNIEKKINITNEDFDFEILEPIEKKTINLSTYKDKIIFLNIWATWCSPCREELPSMDSLKQKFANNKDVVFLNISDDNLVNILKFKQKHQYTLNFYLHNNNLPSILSGNSIPRTYIIKNKKIIYRLVGARNWNTNDVMKLLK